MLAIKLCECCIELRIHAVQFASHFRKMPFGPAGSDVEQFEFLRGNASKVCVDCASHLLGYFCPICLCACLQALLLLPLEINLCQLKGRHLESEYALYVSIIYHCDQKARPRTPTRRVDGTSRHEDAVALRRHASRMKHSVLSREAACL